MSKDIEKKLLQIPVISTITRILMAIKIPALKGFSLYDVLEIYVLGIVKGALSARAGGIAFSFLMSIFPFLIFILTLIPFVPIPGFQEDFFYLMEQWLPPSTSDYIRVNIISYIQNHHYGLFYFFLSIFLMTNGINAIFGGFEYSYHLKSGRNFFHQYLYALGVSLLLSVYLILTVAGAFYFEVGIERLKDAGWLENDVFWVVFFQRLFFILMVFISISTLFYFGTREGKQHSFFSAGSIMTTLLIILSSYLFGIYVARYSKYTELYGSIGTLLIFMLYIWLNSILLLLGFELNASIHRIRKRIN